MYLVCEFNYANRIICLKIRCVSVYSVKVIKILRLAIDRLLFYGRFTGRFVVAKQTAQLFGP